VQDSAILPAYLGWWLNQPPAQSYIMMQRTGSTIPFVSVASLAQLEVRIPTLEIQKKILHLEALRQKETYLNSLLLEKKYALIREVSLKAIE
jgi:restriction endonuclease S subunit